MAGLVRWVGGDLARRPGAGLVGAVQERRRRTDLPETAPPPAAWPQQIVDWLAGMRLDADSLVADTHDPVAPAGWQTRAGIWAAVDIFAAVTITRLVVPGPDGQVRPGPWWVEARLRQLAPVEPPHGSGGSSSEHEWLDEPLSDDVRCVFPDATIEWLGPDAIFGGERFWRPSWALWVQRAWGWTETDEQVRIASSARVAAEQGDLVNQPWSDQLWECRVIRTDCYAWWLDAPDSVDTPRALPAPALNLWPTISDLEDLLDG